MFQKLRKQNEGFTIIEVLIVLAIAGLILLIVFLAVPALQRNSRNTSRKNDVGRIGGAVSEFMSNNNGSVPATNAHRDQIITSAGTLSQYSFSGGGAGDLLIATGGTPGAIDNLNQMRIVTGRKCDTATPGAVTAAGASSRSIAVQYAVENSSATPTSVCQEV